MVREALFTAVALNLIFTSAIVKAIQFGETDISLTEGTTRTVYIRRSNDISNVLTMSVFATTIEGYRQRQVAGVSSGCNTNLSTLIGTDESQVDPAEESDLITRNYTLHFAAQEQEISFDLVVADDTIAENEEVFIIYTSIMESPGDRCSGAVTLRDNDVVQFNFSHVRLDINEDDNLPSMLSIVKTGQNEPIISFQVFVYAGDGSPVQGVDYNANADHNYVFTNETTQLQVATNVVPDRMGESTESIQICLPNLQSPAASVTPTCVTIRIFDDDSVQIGFVGSNTSVNLVEGDPSATVCIDIKPEGLPLDQFDFIPLTIRPTPLQLGSDQVVFGQESLSFNGPNQVNCITVSAIDDEESDGTHMFQLVIVSNPGNSVPVEFRPGSIPITVVDNDVVSFELIVNTTESSNDLQELTNVLEGDSISKLITIRKSGRSKFTYSVTLSVKTMPGILDATQVDIILERNLRFETSANEVDTLDVSFMIPNDAESERRKQFSISIASIKAFDSNTSTEARRDALTDIQRNAIDITVYDNDFVIGFINSTATIAEGSSGVLCVSILDIQRNDISPKFTIPILVSTFNTSSGVLIQTDEITLNSRNNMNCSEVGYLEDNDKCDQARNFSVQLTWMEDPSYTVSFRQRNITVRIDDAQDCAAAVCGACIAVPLLLLIIIGVLMIVAVIILWRVYYVNSHRYHPKHHEEKHNQSNKGSEVVNGLFDVT